MALVAQAVTPVRTFQPFEGMSESQRLVTSVPRGIVRFQATDALDAKPVNDDIILTFTCSLPPSFAYVVSSLSLEIQVDTADEWDAFVRVQMFNTLPSAAPGNRQVSLFDFEDYRLPLADAEKILTFRQGTIRDWYPQPLVRSVGAVGMTFLVVASNGNANVQAAGTMFFNAAFYQYELNQAVRFPLNSPVPVGIR